MYDCTANNPEFYVHDGDRNVIGLVSNIKVFILVQDVSRRMLFKSQFDFINGNGGTQSDTSTRGYGRQSIRFRPALANGEVTIEEDREFINHGIPRHACHYSPVRSTLDDEVRRGYDIVFERLNFEITPLTGVQTDC